MIAWLSFPNAIFSLLLVLVFFSNFSAGTEPDIWWHLRNGKHMVETHSFPTSDQYSYTATGSPWLDHEWLAELAFYGAFRGFGLRGVFGLYFGLAILIFVGLFRLAWRAGANPKDVVAVGIIAVLLAKVSFGPRMLLFGWLLMVVLLLLLQQFAEGRVRRLWILPPMFCLWINLHGSWLFGMMALTVFIAGGLFEGEWGGIVAKRFQAEERKHLFTIWGSSFLALLVTPFGYRLMLYPFDLAFRQQININNIDEWQSVDFHDPRGKVVMILLLMVFAALLISKKQWRVHEVVLAGIAYYWGLTYARMQFFAAIIFLPLLAPRLRLFPPYDPDKEKPVLNALIIAAALWIFIARFPTESSLRTELDATYPQAALEYMRAHNISDRVFHEYGWGGYMIWHTPEIKTFIDGRADLFVYSGVFKDYLDIMRIEKPFELMDKYQIRYALFQPNTPRAYLLGHSACWKKLFEDKRAVLFERNEMTPDNCKLKVQP